MSLQSLEKVTTEMESLQNKTELLQKEKKSLIFVKIIIYHKVNLKKLLSYKLSQPLNIIQKMNIVI